MSEKDHLINNHETKEDKNETEEANLAHIIIAWFSNFIVKNFLPFALIVAVVFGAFVPAPGVFFNHDATVYICVSILFFYVALYLETSEMKEAVKAYRAFTWGCFNILVVTGVIGGQLTNLLTFDDHHLVASNSLGTNSTAVNITSSDASIVTEKHLGPFECKVGLIMYAVAVFLKI